MTSVAGDPDIAATLAAGRLADLPASAIAAGLRLPLHEHLGLEPTGLAPVTVELPVTGQQIRSLDAPVHGGVVATLADVAANIAAATSGSVDVTRYGLGTARLELDYRARPTGDRPTTPGCSTTRDDGRTRRSAPRWTGWSGCCAARRRIRRVPLAELATGGAR